MNNIFSNKKILFYLVLLFIFFCVLFSLLKDNGAINIESKLAVTNIVNKTSDAKSTLRTFYDEIDNDEKIETNKFNCSSSGCTASDYTGAGLLTKYEYDTIGGINSYLNINDSYYVLDNNNLKQLNQDGSTNIVDSSKVRPSMYIDGETKVTGSGRIDDPYIINKRYYLVIETSENGSVSKTSDRLVKGESTNLTVTPNVGYYLSSVECTSGYDVVAVTGVGATGVQNVTITNNEGIDGRCTFNFIISSYTLTINKSGSGNISKTSETLNYGSSTTVDVTPSEGYHLSAAVCNGNYTLSGVTIGSTSAQTVTISNNNRTNAAICTFTFSINTNTLAVNPNSGTVTFNGADRTSSTSVTQNYNTTIAVPNPKTLPTYTITYDGNSQGASYTASPTNVTRPFTSYSASSNCGTLNNGSYTFPSSKDTTCTLTAEYNNTSNSFTLPSISRTGYTCKWAEGSASGTKYNGGTSRTITGNTTYYAKCSINSYTVTIAKSGSGTLSKTSASVAYGGSTTVDVTPSAGYYLSAKSCTNSWTTNGSTGTSYTSKQPITISNNSNTSAATCTFTFTKLSYTVAYNANGGSGAPSNQTKTYGDNLTISTAVPTKSGYSFEGWATSSTGSVAYQPGGTYSNNSSVTLYAVWKKKKQYLGYYSGGDYGAALLFQYGSNLYKMYTEIEADGTYTGKPYISGPSEIVSNINSKAGLAIINFKGEKFVYIKDGCLYVTSITNPLTCEIDSDSPLATYNYYEGTGYSSYYEGNIYYLNNSTVHSITLYGSNRDTTPNIMGPTSSSVKLDSGSPLTIINFKGQKIVYIKDGCLYVSSLTNPLTCEIDSDSSLASYNYYESTGYSSYYEGNIYYLNNSIIHSITLYGSNRDTTPNINGPNNTNIVTDSGSPLGVFWRKGANYYYIKNGCLHSSFSMFGELTCDID